MILAATSNAKAFGNLIGTLLFPLVLMIIIGGVYYLLKRPALSFRQAMFTDWIVTASVAIWLLSLLGRMMQYAK